MADGVEITPGNTSELLAGQLDELRGLARDAMREATAIAAEELGRIAPGHIGETVQQRLGGSPGTVTGTVFPGDPHAKYAEEGTGIYVEFRQPIRPLAARRTGNPRATLMIAPGVFRRQVQGQRPQRFIERARDAAEGRVEQTLMRPAEEITRKLAG